MLVKRTIYLVISILSLLFFSGSIFILPVSAQGPNDAIAIRVVANPDRLPPLTWYQRNVPNPGSPAVLEVNGYPAVRDGRTVYVAAANYVASAGAVFSNIYIISHSLSENEKTEAVFSKRCRRMVYEEKQEQLKRK